MSEFQPSMLRIWTWVNSDHLLQLVFYLYNKINKFVICLCNHMSLSQRRLTYGMTFHFLNTGILQSMKHIRKSNFLKIQKFPSDCPVGCLKEVLTTRKIQLKYIYACVSVQMCTILKTRDFVFTYLNCLSCLHFFMVYLKSDKVSILFYISSKGVPDDWS